LKAPFHFVESQTIIAAFDREFSDLNLSYSLKLFFFHLLRLMVQLSGDRKSITIESEDETLQSL